jgi:hypothetical protein
MEKKKQVSIIICLLLFGISTTWLGLSASPITTNRTLERISPLRNSSESLYLSKESPLDLPTPTLAIQSGSISPVFADHNQTLRATNDTLRFSMQFQANETAYYHVEVAIYNSTSANRVQIGNSLSWGDSVTANINVTPMFDFCGYKFRQAGFNGPYAVYMRFYMDTGITRYIYGESGFEDVGYQTKAYKATDFADIPINILSISSSFIDNDGNSLNEWIDIHINVDVTIADEYRFEGEIDFGGFQDNAYNRIYLNTGPQTVTLRFAPWEWIDEGITSTEVILNHLYIRHDTYPEWHIYESNPGYSTAPSYYSSSDFDLPPFSLTGRFWEHTVDTDGDSQANIYKVTMEVEKTRIETGEMGFKSNLFIDSSDQYIYYAYAIYTSDFKLNTLGFVNVTFEFTGLKIFQSGIWNDYLNLSNIGGYYYHMGNNWNDWYYFDESWKSNQQYNYTDFDGPGALLTGSFSDYGSDTDADSLYNYIVVEVGLTVTEAGEYQVSGAIRASTGNNFAWDSIQAYYSPGTYGASLQFEAHEIARQGINDTIYLDYINLYGGDPWANLNSTGSIALSWYDHTQVDPPKALLRWPSPFSDFGYDGDDPDSKWDEIRLVVETTINDAGYYQVSGYLRNPSTGRTTNTYYSDFAYASVDVKSFIIKFPGDWFWAQHVSSTNFILSSVSVHEVDSNGNYIKEWDYQSDVYQTNGYASDDFTSPPAYFTGNFVESRRDIDSDGDYDFFIISAQIEATKSIYVEGYAYLDAITEGLDAWNYTYINSAGFYWIQFKFPVTRLYSTLTNQNYTVDFTLYRNEEPWGLLDEYLDYKTDYYLYSQWDPPSIGFTGVISDYGVDTDSPTDGSFDYLNLSVEVEVYQAGYFHLWGSVYAEEGGDSYSFGWGYNYLNIGTHTITFQIPHVWVRSHLDGTAFYIAYMYLYEDIPEWGSETQAYDDTDHYLSRIYNHNEFDLLEAWVVRIADDYTVDTNNDSLYDFWNVVFEINVTKDNIDLYLRAEMAEKETDSYIADAYGYVYGLSIGLHNITLQFSGNHLYKSGFTQGALISYYRLELISDPWYELDRSYDDYPLSGDYQWDQFSSTFILISQIDPPDRSVFLRDDSFNVWVYLETSEDEEISWIEVQITVDGDWYDSIGLTRSYYDSTYEEWYFYLQLEYGNKWEFAFHVYGTQDSYVYEKITYYILGGPSIYDFTTNISAVMVGGTIKFTADVYDFDGIANVTLYVENNEVAMAYEGNSTYGEFWTAVYTFNNIGSFDVYVIAIDTTGKMSESDHLTIHVNEGPEILNVDVTPGKKVKLDEEITFTVTIQKSDAIISSVTLEVIDNNDKSFLFTLNYQSDTEVALIYSGSFTPESVGKHVCTIRVLTTKNQVSSYEVIITVEGESNMNITPGFEMFMTLALLVSLPISKKVLRRK